MDERRLFLGSHKGHSLSSVQKGASAADSSRNLTVIGNQKSQHTTEKISYKNIVLPDELWRGA